MYVAVLSSDQQRAKRLGDEILDICLNNGCYSTFLSFAADDGFLKELEQREFNTVVITADNATALQMARKVADKQPNAKLVLLGSDRTAVEGYALNAHYCSVTQPQKEDLERIVEIIFPLCVDIERMEHHDN